MSDFDNGLIPEETERLAILAEECAEVIQMVGKILRHGYASHHPDGVVNNRGLLAQELGDLSYVIDWMQSQGDVAGGVIALRKRLRPERMRPYLHHQFKESTDAD